MFLEVSKIFCTKKIYNHDFPSPFSLSVKNTVSTSISPFRITSKAHYICDGNDNIVLYNSQFGKP